MDQSQETKFRTLLEGIATSTGKTDFLNEILDLSKKRTELLQTLTRVSSNRDKVMHDLEEAHDLRDVEITLRDYKGDLLKEIKQNVELLTFLQKVDIPQKMQQRQVTDEIGAKEFIDKLAPSLISTDHIEPPSESDFDPEEQEAILKEILGDDSIRGDAERGRALLEKFKETDGKRENDDFIERVKADNKLIDESNRIRLEMAHTAVGLLANQMVLNQLVYQAQIASAASLIPLLKTLFKKYNRELRLRPLIRWAIRTFFLLIIGTLLVGMLLSRVDLWWLSLLLLPIIIWVLIDRVFQPYLEKRLFIKKREDLKLLLTEFYTQSILARCYLALAKHFVDSLP